MIPVQAPGEFLQQPVTCLPGIGPARAAALAGAFGIRTVAELLACAPRRYEDPARESSLAEARDGEAVRAAVSVTACRLRRFRGRSTLSVEIRDGTATATALYFNQPWLKESLPAGRELLLEGRVSARKGLCLIAPRIVAPGEPAGGLRPVYPAAEGVPAGLLARALAAALARPFRVPDPLPAAVLAAAGVPPLERALRDLHAPPDRRAAEAGRRRLAWGEILKHERRRRTAASPDPGPPCAREARVWARIRARIPFALTAGQEEVLAELRAELAAGRRLTRLLHGEVGSGKTAVAFALALAAAAEGGQAALLAPTEILARQHLATFRSWLRGSRLRVVGLLGDDPPAGRRQALGLLRRRTAVIAVGTHALYGPAVRFADLRLVVFDEQHRFGVRQKAALLAKGRQPHVLTMTATPIPRTLAWAHYGALEPCVLRSPPGGAGEVRTRVAALQTWPALARRLRRFLDGPRARLFVVVPRIDGPGGLERRARQLLDGPWKGVPAALVHGRLPGSEVAAAVEAFQAGAVKVLLGTTVVEVGLDVPDVPAMVVLDADRLGLASLHQLRGRLARGPGARPARCWLLGRPESLQRLKQLELCRDGFAVAEADLRDRGPGALRGTRQHGRSGFRLFDPLRDAPLVDALRRPEVKRWLESGNPALPAV